MYENSAKTNKESKLLKLALDNKQIAIAILGQALLDEGGIGAQGITVYYTSQEEAFHLWQIANSLGYANPFRKRSIGIMSTTDFRLLPQSATNFTNKSVHFPTQLKIGCSNTLPAGKTLQVAGAPAKPNN
jgi:hypothetical protein